MNQTHPWLVSELVYFDDFPQEHTQNGLMLCGGGEDKLGCYSLTPEGAWLKTHDLIKERVHHVSWETEDGVLLIGGARNPENTELGELLKILEHWNITLSFLVKSDGTTEESFSLKSSTSWVFQDKDKIRIFSSGMLASYHLLITSFSLEVTPVRQRHVRQLWNTTRLAGLKTCPVW